MPIVYNGTLEDVHIKAHGNFFMFKPNATKKVGDALANFIREHRLEDGLVILPSEFEDQENDGSFNKAYAETEEGKTLLLQWKQKSIDNLVGKHRRVIMNNQVSLANDLGKINDKSNPAIFASEKNLQGWSAKDSFELVMKYSDMKKDQEQADIDRIKTIMEKVA